jgi:hypothetical protein
MVGDRSRRWPFRIATTKSSSNSLRAAKRGGTE